MRPEEEHVSPNKAKQDSMGTISTICRITRSAQKSLLFSIFVKKITKRKTRFSKTYLGLLHCRLSVENLSICF
jgi:hypothetical protein